MPDIAALVDPARTAILTMEVQRGTVGDRSPFAELVDAAKATHLIDHMASLLGAGRAAGVAVVHCTAEFRPNLKGSGTNAPLLAAMTRHLEHIRQGSDGVELIPEIFDPENDLVCPRLSGVSPFAGTSLDTWLANMGITTVVATGVSVNLAIIGLCIEAVNLGYRVVLPVDAIAGFPGDYVEAVIANTLSLVAWRSSVGEIVEAWSQ